MMIQDLTLKIPASRGLSVWNSKHLQRSLETIER